MSKRIVLASDHRGVKVKSEIANFLKSKGFVVQDVGTDSEVSVDYSDFAIRAAEAVSRNEADQGIVVCHSGIGVSVSANKVKGIRAALCHTVEQAALAKRHANANVLAIPAGFVSSDLVKKIVERWVESDFEGGRHQRRIEKISRYEEEK
jgi:ribose 5-phosphate isomerase B